MSGRTVGKYELRRVLGSGAFATVWLAYDPDLDAEVAVKVLAENWSANAEVRARFVQEARILWALDSDRVARVYTMGETDDGRPYFVMEHADRGTLQQRMRERRHAGRPFTVEEAVALGREIGACLEVIHELGIVHRDLKPSNVLLRSARARRRDAGDAGDAHLADERLLLVDFGIARRMELARTNTIAAGTPYYMAPEQSDPQTAGRVDERSDLYAATVILYELLAGAVPYPFESTNEVLRAQVSGTVRPLAEVRADVPAALDAFVLHGLSLDPNRRMPSARAWVDALAAAATDSTQLDLPPLLPPLQPSRAPAAGGATPAAGAPGDASTLFPPETGGAAPATREPVPGRTVPTAAVVLGGLLLVGVSIFATLLAAGALRDGDDAGGGRPGGTPTAASAGQAPGDRATAGSVSGSSGGTSTPVPAASSTAGSTPTAAGTVAPAATSTSALPVAPSVAVGSPGCTAGAADEVVTAELAGAAARLVATGGRHTLVVGPDGSLWAWGANDRGQLGDASLVSRREPVQIRTLNAVEAVSAYGSSSLALLEDGTVWSWGAQNYPGDGSGHRYAAAAIRVPTQVQIAGIVALAAGDRFGVMLAADGSVWTWGVGGDGQLGNGELVDSPVPVRVQGLSDVVAVAAGDAHALAIRRDGTLWAWGRNREGQLGDATTADRPVPVQVLDLQDVVAVDAAGSGSYAVTGDGSVWGWGTSWLGDGSDSAIRGIPERSAGVGDAVWVSASSAVLVVRRDGVACSWGEWTGRAEPGSDGFTADPVTGVPQVLAGAVGTDQRVLVGADGSLWMWGKNDEGQLGTGGSPAESATPLRLEALRIAVSTPTGARREQDASRGGRRA